MGFLLSLARELIGIGVGTAAFAAGSQIAGALQPGGPTLRESLGLKSRRARRRKMFTNTDLAQFAAASAFISKQQVAALMMVRAARA